MSIWEMSGIHHLKFPMTDIEASVRWFCEAFGAERVVRFDYRDQDGTLYAAMLRMPGLASPIELRHAPKAARAVAGYDTVTFGVSDKETLDAWVEHFDAVGVTHSPIIKGYIGPVVGVETRDGLVIRIYTDPVGGFDQVEFCPDRADIAAPSLNAPLMDRH